MPIAQATRTNPQQPEGSVGERTVVVTGAGSGIGRACAELLTGTGFAVAACDVDQGAVTALASRSGQMQAFGADVSDDASVRALAAAVDAGMPPVFAVVNCAGWDETLPFPETDSAFRQKGGAINYLGVGRGRHAFLRALVERAAGPDIERDTLAFPAVGDRSHRYVVDGELEADLVGGKGVGPPAPEGLPNAFPVEAVGPDAAEPVSIASGVRAVVIGVAEHAELRPHGAQPVLQVPRAESGPMVWRKGLSFSSSSAQPCME